MILGSEVHVLAREPPRPSVMKELVIIILTVTGPSFAALYGLVESAIQYAKL